jgi:hypothetical protein
MPTKKPDQTSSVFQLKATLNSSRPPIWRKVLVPANLSFVKLHLVLQSVMGWENCHMHQFVVGEKLIGSHDLDAGSDVVNEARTRLNQLVTGPPEHFTYEYDFGDNWELLVSVEKVLEAEPGQTYPVCIGGKMAAPPDDSGGIWHYFDMLDILKNPDHPEYKDCKDHLGKDFDPKHLDLAEINARLQRRKW